MSERHRELPSWMDKKQFKVKGRAPLEIQSKSKKARIVCYCMNEAELVQTAVSYLSNGAFVDVTLPIHQQVKDETNDIKKKSIDTKLTTKSMTKSSEDKSLQCNDLDTTCESETDLDITEVEEEEVETLPYTKIQPYCESECDETDTTHDDYKDLDTKTKKKKKLEVPSEDDSALQLVREIFFT